MSRPPAQWAWRNARDVAEQALDGFVMKQVGTATHYHTDWVVASWTPTLLKIGQIGAHIFFRPIGPEGDPAEFRARYGGGEAQASKTDLIGKPTLADHGDVPRLVKAAGRGLVTVPRLLPPRRPDHGAAGLGGDPGPICARRRRPRR